MHERAATNTQSLRSPDVACHRSARELRGPGFFFIGGNRRSGTTWLTSMLNDHPAIAVRNEGWMINEWGSSVESWLNDDAFKKWADLPSSPSSWLTDMDAGEARLAVLRGMMEGIMREAVRRSRKRPGQVRMIGDKTTTFYCTRAELLHSLFPDARFIHIVRDGRDTVVSDLFLKFRYKAFECFGETGEDHARRAFSYHVDGVGPEVPLFSPETLRPLLDIWIRSLDGASRARSLFGESFFEIRYEDLRENPGRITEIFEFLGVSSDAAIAAKCTSRNTFEKQTKGRKPGDADPLSFRRKGIIGDWHNYFTEGDKELFKKLAGKRLIDLGYEHDLTW